MDYKDIIGKDVSFLEAALEEDLLLAVESLIDTDAISGNIPENSNQPWNLTVRDQNFHYQVVIELGRDTIKSVKCNCVKYKKGDLCLHVAGGLLYVRKNRPLSQSTPNTSKSSKKTPTNTKKTVAQMSHSELKQFVLDYAKKDALFKLLLLARQFATLSSDERERIIEKSFPVITKVGQKVSARHVSAFITVTEEIFPIIAELLANDNYVEGYDIIQLLLKKSFYIKSKMTTINKRFISNHNALIHQFQDIHDIIEAPEFKESIHTQIIDLISASYVSANTDEEKKLWLLIFHQTSLKEKLREVVTASLNKGKDEDLDSYYFMLTLHLLLMEGDDLDKEVVSLDSQSSYRVIQLLLLHDYIDGAERLFMSLILNASISGLLTRQILAQLKPRSIDSHVEKRIVELFLQSGDIIYLDWLLTHSHDKSSTQQTIDTLMADANSDDLKIQFYLFMERGSDALSVLESNPNKTLLMKYDQHLIKDHADAILAIYKTICQEYISSHFGSASRDFMIDIYQHLTRINAHKLKNKLQSFVKSEFTNRQSLNV